MKKFFIVVDKTDIRLNDDEIQIGDEILIDGSMRVFVKIEEYGEDVFYCYYR